MAVMKLLLLGLGLVISSSLWAGEAVFSGNGSRLYLLPLGEGAFLNVLDLESYKITQRSVASWVGKQPVVGLCRSSGDQILFCTSGTVWAWSPSRNTASKLCQAPEGQTIQDIAYDPKNHWTLLTCYQHLAEAQVTRFSLWLRRDDAQTLASVFVRRVENVAGPVFDAQGNLFFGSHGDLWHGQIQWDGEKDAGRGVLHAYRFCPLATLETSMATPAQTGARAMALARDRLYVHVKRLGGSGWGDIVSVKVPAGRFAENGELDLVLDLAARTELSQQSLASIQRLAEGGGWCHLCATPDGKTVHYTAGSAQGRLHWLVRDQGEPVQLTRLIGSLK